MGHHEALEGTTPVSMWCDGESEASAIGADLMIRCDCTVHSEADGLVEELAALKAVLDRIPASTIINVAVSWSDGTYRFWYGCGICQGEYVRNNPVLVTKRPVYTDPRYGLGAYLHKDWCPRRS